MVQISRRWRKNDTKYNIKYSGATRWYGTVNGIESFQLKPGAGAGIFSLILDELNE